MDDTIEERLAAVERALTDEDHDLTGLAEGETAHRVDRLAGDLDDLDDRVAELEAATQALRGYVGNVRAVNEEVRERADLALDAVDSASGKSGTADSPETAEPTLSLESEPDGRGDGRRDRFAGPSTAAETPSADAPDRERESDREQTLSGHTDGAATDDHCPYCDGDRRPSQSADGGGGDPRGPSGDRRGRTDDRLDRTGETPERADGRRDSQFESVTDGGRVDEGAANTDDAGLLRQIRSLL